MKRLMIVAILLFSFNQMHAQNRKYTLEGNELKTAMPVSFKPGTDVLEASSDSGLNEVKSYLTDKTYISLIRIESHVAAAGSDGKKDLELTKKRALAIAKWLVKNGVDSTRIIAVAFGSRKPVADDSNAEAKLLNTRVSFVNAALKGRPIGGMPVDGGGVTVCSPCSF